MGASSTTHSVDAAGRDHLPPKSPSSNALENQTHPDSSSARLPRPQDVDSENSSTSTSTKKRLKQCRDEQFPSKGRAGAHHPHPSQSSADHSHESTGEGGVSSSSSLSQNPFSSPSVSSSSSLSCSNSALVGSEPSGRNSADGVRNDSSSPTKSNVKKFDNSEDHSLQQQHFSQPSAVSSSSLNNESSTSIKLRGINT